MFGFVMLLIGLFAGWALAKHPDPDDEPDFEDGGSWPMPGEEGYDELLGAARGCLGLRF